MFQDLEIILFMLYFESINMNMANGLHTLMRTQRKRSGFQWKMFAQQLGSNQYVLREKMDMEKLKKNTQKKTQSFRQSQQRLFINLLLCLTEFLT